MAEREPYFCTITDSSCSVGLKATWGLGNQFYVFPGKKPTLLHGGHHTTGKEEIIREVRWDTDLHQPVFRKLVNEAHNIFLCLQQQAKETTGAALHPHIVKSSKRYRASLKAYSLELKYLAEGFPHSDALFCTEDYRRYRFLKTLYAQYLVEYFRQP